MAKPTPPNFLTREQIDSIMDSMTARDLFNAMPQGTEGRGGTEIAAKVFDVAAERQGHGREALDRVRPQDAVYLATELGERIAVGSPKAGNTGS